MRSSLLLSLLLLLFLPIGSAGPTTNSPSCMCDPDALKQAVLDRIFDSGAGQEIYNNEQEDADHPTSGRLNAAQKQIDRLRRYADKLTDHCLKDAYFHWISFYQSQHDDEMDLLTHPRPPKVDEAEERRKKQEREVEECKRKGTVPIIPSGALGQ